MKTQLLKHAWLQFKRSPTLTQNVIQTIVLGFFALYFILTMIGLAFMLPTIIKEELPEQDLLVVTGGLIGYYFLTDLIMRFFLQKFPTLTIKPYLGLPIKKSGLSHYLLFRSLGSFFNILPFFFFIPFFFKNIVPVYPAEAVNFALFFIGTVLLNHFISFGIAKNMGVKGGWSGLIIFLLLLVFFLEYQGYFSLFNHLKNALAIVIANPILSAIPLLLSGGLYFVLHRFFKNQLYLEHTQSEKKLLGANLSIGWFERFGDAGKLMDLELKLMLRSKRARAYLMTSFIFLLYPLMFISPGMNVMDSPYIMIFVSLFLTGMIALNHGQLLLSWNSLHFDLLMSRGHTIYDIFSAKYYILVLSCLLTYILSFAYIFLAPKLILYSTVMLLFNMSVSVFAYMFLASYNSLRIDPNEGGAFSFDGFGAAHFLIGIPIMGVPCFIYWVGTKFGGEIMGLILLGVIGVLGIIFHKNLLGAAVNNFKKNRYKISAAFRKNN